MVRPKRNMVLFRQNILEAAWQEMLRSTSEDLTMMDLARRVDMSVGNVYKCFQSKDEVMLFVCLRYYRELAELLKNPAHHSLLDVLSAYLSFVNARFNLYVFIMRRPFWHRAFLRTPLADIARLLQFQILRVVALARLLLVRLQEGRAVATEKLPDQLLYLFNSLHGLLMSHHTGLSKSVNRDRDVVSQSQLQLMVVAITHHH